MLRSFIYGTNIINTNIDIPHLLTYPRSGSHYFEDVLYKEAKIHFTQSHYIDGSFDINNNKLRQIITIARNPVDTLSSYLAFFDLHASQQEFMVREKITEYVLMYSFLCENADYVIDFNDLVERPESTIKTLLSLLDINENDYHLFDRRAVNKYKTFIPSSKSLPTYNKNALDGLDISSCYFYYNKLLSKKITL